MKKPHALNCVQLYVIICTDKNTIRYAYNT